MWNYLGRPSFGPFISRLPARRSDGSTWPLELAHARGDILMYSGRPAIFIVVHGQVAQTLENADVIAREKELLDMLGV